MIVLPSAEHVGELLLSLVNASLELGEHQQIGEHPRTFDPEQAIRRGMDRLFRGNFFKSLERMADGGPPHAGNPRPLFLSMLELEHGVQLVVRMPHYGGRPARTIDELAELPDGLEFARAMLLIVWSDKDVRERLRRCTNCGKFYFQKSKKRNRKGHYFCTTIDADSSCRQDFCDIERGRKKAPITVSPPFATTGSKSAGKRKKK